MKEGGTSLNKTFREYNLVFKGLKAFMKMYMQYCSNHLALSVVCESKDIYSIEYTSWRL